MRKSLLFLIIAISTLLILAFMFPGCKKEAPAAKEIVTAKEKVVKLIKAIVKGEATIVVYLKDDISEELKENIEKEIKSWEEVKEVKYISKEQELERFKEQNEGINILKEIKGNPLSASFEIKLKSYKNVEQVVLRFLDEDSNYIEGVNDVVY